MKATAEINTAALVKALLAANGDPGAESKALYAHCRTWECGGRQHSKRSLFDRLMSRVVFGASDCWHFCGSRNQFGYGRLTVGGRMQVVHRLSYGLFVGPIPDGLSVLHHCDNPSCINPEHLWLGTYSDNSRDCWAKGRHPLAEWVRERQARKS